MTGIAITDRSYKGTPQREHLSDCLGCEQRNINRCKEYRIHFVFQILKSDSDRIKHMSVCIVLISKKDYIIGSQVAFQNICMISGYHYYFGAEDADGNLSLMVPEKEMPAGAEIC